MPASWFNIAAVPRLHAQSRRTARIKIHDVIGGWGIGAEDFIRDLENLGEIDELEIDINSPGGSVNAGLTIYDAIRNHSASVKRTVATGLAASMGSVILLAGDERHIAKNARVMVHRVTGTASGTSEEMQKAAELAKKFEDRILAIYAERTGQEPADLQAMMNSLVGTWMIGEEAVTRGFAHRVLGDQPAAPLRASWSSHFHFSHAALFDSAATPSAASGDISSPDNTHLMKLNEAQKARLLAIHAKASRADAEQKEYDNLLACEDAAAFLAEHAAESRRTALKAAGLSDDEIAAVDRMASESVAAAALQKKRDALKAAGLSEKQIDATLKAAAKKAETETFRASLQSAGLSEDEITAAIRTKKKDNDDDESEEPDDDEDDNKALQSELASLRAELSGIRELVKAGVITRAGGVQPPAKSATAHAPGGGNGIPTCTPEVFAAMTNAEKSKFAVSGGRVIDVSLN